MGVSFCHAKRELHILSGRRHIPHGASEVGCCKGFVQDHLPAGALRGFLQKRLRATNPAHQPKSAPENAKNGPKTSPKGVPGASWATLGAFRWLLSAVGGDFGGPSGAKRGQHGPTLGQLGANLGSKEGPHEPKRDLRETIQGSRGLSESDFWEAKSKNCVLLQTCVFLQENHTFRGSGVSVGSLLGALFDQLERTNGTQRTKLAPRWAQSCTQVYKMRFEGNFGTKIIR